MAIDSANRCMNPRRLAILLASAGLVVGLPALPARSQDTPPETVTPPATAVTPEAVDAGALEKLTAAAGAVREARALSFRLKTRADGLLANGTPLVDFAIKMLRDPAHPAGWIVRVTGEGRRRANEDPQEVSAAFTNDEITWVDTPAKQVTTKPIRSARSQHLQIVYAARVMEFMTDDPLGRELKAGEIALEGHEELDGVACDIIGVRARSKGAKSRWWIGQTDHLPRRLEKLVESTSKGGSSTMDFLEMHADGPLTPADVEVPTPDGFTRASVGGTPAGLAGVPAHPAPRPETETETVRPPDSVEAGTEASNSETAGPAPRPAEASPTPVEHAAPPAPRPAADEPVDLQLEQDNGTKVSLASMRGRPVVLYFMGTWSLPSRSLLPELERLKTAYNGEIPVLALAVRERYPEKVAEFIKSMGATLRAVPRADGAARALDIRLVPAVVVLDADGVVRKSIQGVRQADVEELGVLIPELIKPPGAADAAPSSADRR